MDARPQPAGVEEITADPGSEDPGLHMAVCHVEAGSSDPARARVTWRRVTWRRIPWRPGLQTRRAVVLRRFTRGRSNFERVYRPLADAWAMYDNSGVRPRLLEKEP